MNLTWQRASTLELEPQALAAARALMDVAFDGDFADDDWDHALGGIHVLAWAQDTLVGHASFSPRTLFHGGRAWRTAYVEAVAVHPAFQRRGVATRLMADLMEAISAHGYELGALGITDESGPLYRKLGWQPWRGPTACVTPTGTVRTPDEDGAVYVLVLHPGLDLDGELACDFRAGDVW